MGRSEIRTSNKEIIMAAVFPPHCRRKGRSLGAHKHDVHQQDEYYGGNKDDAHDLFAFALVFSCYSSLSFRSCHGITF